MSATADKRVPVSGGKDVSFADRGVSTANNNLPSDFLLGHPGKPIPEPYPGSGVALRQTIIYRRLIVTVNYSFFILHSDAKRRILQGGCVRRSRTFSVPKARKIQNSRFCQPPSDRRMKPTPKPPGLPPLIICKLPDTESRLCGRPLSLTAV